MNGMVRAMIIICEYNKTKHFYLPLVFTTKLLFFNYAMLLMRRFASKSYYRLVKLVYGCIWCANYYYRISLLLLLYYEADTIMSNIIFHSSSCLNDKIGKYL